MIWRSPFCLTYNQGLTMSQRLQDTTIWIWCLFVLYSGSLWKPVNSTSVKVPPKNPSPIEAQAKFFQDFFSVQLSPYKIEFGHVCEDPNTWEQRYEKKDFKNHRDMGKVRWGDKKGGYGEHYWDLNHAGHTNDHDHGYDDGSDDGSYHEDRNDSYDEPHDDSPSYSHEEYKAEPSNVAEISRTKRPQTRHNVKTRKTEKIYDEDESQSTKKVVHKNNERYQKEEEEDDDDDEETEDVSHVTVKPLKKQIIKQEKEIQQPKENNHVVLVINHKDKEEPKQEVLKQSEDKQYVPYEQGAGVRQHYREAVVSPSPPRLFLEPTTGHVVDRATGQAYVLQPVIRSFSPN